jgi:peptidoglycan/LPS O-acetylase OafA/YrhL
MIYPVFWWVSKKSILVASSVMAALFFLSFFPSIWPLTLVNNIFTMMLAWWFGVLLADIFSGRLSVSFARIAPLSAVLLILPALHLNNIVKDILWAIGFTGLIAACFALQERGRKLKLLASLKPLGDMSFTLYVIHFPLLVLASGYLMSLSPSHELPRHLGWSLVGCCIVLAVSWVVHLFAEKPFVTRKVHATT